MAEFSVLPIENSLGGSIHAVYDLLLRYRLHIVGETSVSVNHCLLALPGTKVEELTRVMSHPQALAQVDGYLRKLKVGLGLCVFLARGSGGGVRRLFLWASSCIHDWSQQRANQQTPTDRPQPTNRPKPNPNRPPRQVVKEAVDDTAGAAQMVAQQQLKGVAAVASRRAAELYGLEILDEGIQDYKDNVTRFIKLSRYGVWGVGAGWGCDAGARQPPPSTRPLSSTNQTTINHPPTPQGPPGQPRRRQRAPLQDLDRLLPQAGPRPALQGLIRFRPARHRHD
jgi:hypothetical protein